MMRELDIETVSEIKTISEIKKDNAKGNLIKKYLNKFDLVLVDDRLSLTTLASALGGHTIVMKKRHFPMPVKITDQDSTQIKKNLVEAFETVGLLLSSGQEYIVKCAKTESMTKKEAVKNVINCALKATSLIMFSQSKVKHNNIKEISL